MSAGFHLTNPRNEEIHLTCYKCGKEILDPRNPIRGHETCLTSVGLEEVLKFDVEVVDKEYPNA